MLRKTILILAVVASLAIAGWLIATNGCSDPAANVTDAGAADAKEIVDIKSNENDLVFQLDGENTDIKWTGSNSVGQKPSGYFYELTGAATFDSETKAPRKIELTIDMNGVKAMSSSLTEKLKHKGFFEVDKYPQSSFVSTDIQEISEPGEYEGANWLVEGNFQLRDTTKSIKIPLKIEVAGESLKVESKFKINRKDYGVAYSDSTGDALIRDAVLIELAIDSSADATPTTEPVVSSTIQPLENFTETIKPTLEEFDLIFVPGDQAKGLKPFWIGKTEVTWEEFDYWALCKNMSDKDATREISELLRPSAPHDLEKIYRSWGRENQPVVGVSRKSAELYCEWLSRQTGKRYRLPTAEEWEHAFELGGGDLNQQSDSKELQEFAWFADNALSTDDEGFDFERAMPVGTLEPNGLGIHDMLGNAAEWVTGTGDAKVVRGGHFKLPANQLSGAFREEEDQSVWNRDYPQEPKSIWWYVNADYVGFRVVCESE